VLDARVLTSIVALSYICMPSKRDSSGCPRRPEGNRIHTTVSMRNTGTIHLFPVPILDEPYPLSWRPSPQRSLPLVTCIFWKRVGNPSGHSWLICMSSFDDSFNWREVKLGITCKVTQEEESSSLVLRLLLLDPKT